MMTMLPLSVSGPFQFGTMKKSILEVGVILKKMVTHLISYKKCKDCFNLDLILKLKIGSVPWDSADYITLMSLINPMSHIISQPGKLYNYKKQGETWLDCLKCCVIVSRIKTKKWMWFDYINVTSLTGIMDEFMKIRCSVQVLSKVEKIHVKAILVDLLLSSGKISFSKVKFANFCI